MTMNIFFISIPEGIDAQRDSEPFKIIQLPVGDLGMYPLSYHVLLHSSYLSSSL